MARTLEADAIRLLAVHRIMDAVGGIDLHERAMELAEQRGHEEPTDADYLDATREALDVIVKEEFNIQNAAPQGPAQATTGNDGGSERVSSQAPNAPAELLP